MTQPTSPIHSDAADTWKPLNNQSLPTTSSVVSYCPNNEKSLLLRRDVNLSPVNSGLSSDSSNMSDSSFSFSGPKKRPVRDPQSHRMSEKRRRERINASLDNLRELIPASFLQKSVSVSQLSRNRIEKTEIIQTAIKYIEHLQTVQSANSVVDNKIAVSPELNNNDQLFAHCGAHSPQMANLCIEDRFRYHQNGYQDCLLEASSFMNEHKLDGLSDLLMDHLQKHMNGLDVGIISKYMKTNRVADNCDKLSDFSVIRSDSNSSSTIISTNISHISCENFKVKSSPKSHKLFSRNHQIEKNVPLLALPAQALLSSATTFVASSNSVPLEEFIQAFALHPSGHSFIPFRIDSNVLGLDITPVEFNSIDIIKDVQYPIKRDLNDDDHLETTMTKKITSHKRPKIKEEEMEKFEPQEMTLEKAQRQQDSVNSRPLNLTNKSTGELTKCEDYELL